MLDEDGYPDEASLEAIKSWDVLGQGISGLEDIAALTIEIIDSGRQLGEISASHKRNSVKELMRQTVI